MRQLRGKRAARQRNDSIERRIRREQSQAMRSDEPRRAEQKN
jgi:hypothetical protein